MSEEILPETLAEVTEIQNTKQADQSSNDTNQGFSHDDQQKITTLNSNLDDLFSKIAMLTSEIEKPYDVPEIILPPLPVIDETIFKRYQPKVIPNDQINIKKEQHHQKLEQEDPKQDKKLSMKYFELGKTIGQGKFGTVHECKHKSTGMIVALKKIYRSSIQQYGIQAEIENQVTVLSEISHPNIIDLYGFFGDPYHFFIVTEYIPGQTLEKLYKSPPNVVSNILYQVLHALQYLHNKKIVHRDIKPQNLIYFNGVIKLLDFGYAAYVNEKPLNTLCGTLDYVSPQVLQKQPYGLQVDLWALGVLTYQLLTGTVPYKGQSVQQKYEIIQKQQQIFFPPEVPQNAQSFIKSLLQKNPKQRASIETCLAHSFITEYFIEIKTTPQFETIL